MKARGLSVVIVAATLSCAAVAVAQESDPAEPDATPSGDEPAPEDGSPPEYPPPVQTAPAAPPAAPVDDSHFGFAGQITISDDLEMVAARESTEGASASTTVIQLRPAIDFFPIPNLSIGGQLIIGYNSTDDVGGSISSSELGLLVRVGYNVSISDSVSIWPRLALGYDHTGADLGGSINRAPIEVFVPIIVQPASHFFIGGGPIFSTTLLSEQEGIDVPRKTILGLRATVGGYFRGM